MNLSEIIGKMNEVKCIQYSQRGDYEDLDFDYDDDTLNLSFKLTNEDGELKLYVEKYGGTFYLEKYNWPGTREDYQNFIDSLKNFVFPNCIPQLIISLLKD